MTYYSRLIYIAPVFSCYLGQSLVVVAVRNVATKTDEGPVDGLNPSPLAGVPAGDQVGRLFPVRNVLVGGPFDRPSRSTMDPTGAEASAPAESARAVHSAPSDHRRPVTATSAESATSNAPLRRHRAAGVRFPTPERGVHHRRTEKKCRSNVN